MSLMARFGCRDRDLVVEAIAAWAPWARRMRPGGLGCVVFLGLGEFFFP